MEGWAHALSHQIRRLGNEEAVHVLEWFRMHYGGPGDDAALHVASRAGYLNVVAALLDHGANVDRRMSFRIRVCESESSEDLRELCVPQHFASELTPLHRACSEGHENIVALLLDRGAAIDRQDDLGRSALHRAVRGRRENVVALLLQRGASVDQTCFQGCTPLHVASRLGLQSIVTLLLDNGASIHQQLNSNGHAALHLACSEGHENVVSVLLDRGANINQAADGGLTPLHIACPKGQRTYGCFAVLVCRGADINRPDHCGSTPLHYASRYGHMDAVTLLINNGASIDQQNNFGWTPLAYASLVRNKDVVFFLLHQRSSWCFRCHEACNYHGLKLEKTQSRNDF